MEALKAGLMFLLGSLTTMMLLVLNNSPLIVTKQDIFGKIPAPTYYPQPQDVAPQFKMLKLQGSASLSSSSISVIPSGTLEYQFSTRLSKCVNQTTRLVPPLEGGSCIAEDRTIFFVETNVALEEFGGKKLCAFESTALANPDRAVVVMVSTKNKLSQENTNLMSEVPNLYFAAMDFETLVESSPLAKIWSYTNKETNFFPVQFADMVRLLLLHKFGGAYMDSDSFSIGKFPEVPNFIVEDVSRKADLNNGIMQFQKENAFLESILNYVVDYEGDKRRVNFLGPDLFRKVAGKFCPNRDTTDTDVRVKFSCPKLDFKVLKKSLAHRWDTYEYADPKKFPLKEMSNGLNDSFAVHYFGHKFDIGMLKLTKKSPLYILMSPHCPRAAKVLREETPDA